MADPRKVSEERIAAALCVTHLTDGFCMPRNKPDCRCHSLAKAVTAELRRLPDPCFRAGWEVTHKAYVRHDKADPRDVLNALLDYPVGGGNG